MKSLTDICDGGNIRKLKKIDFMTYCCTPIAEKIRIYIGASTKASLSHVPSSITSYSIASIYFPRCILRKIDAIKIMVLNIKLWELEGGGNTRIMAEIYPVLTLLSITSPINLFTAFDIFDPL
jgi:hypothetical protein